MWQLIFTVPKFNAIIWKSNFTEKEPFYFPLKMEFSTCGFISNYHTYDEIETCRNIILLDETLLDPLKYFFEISSMQEDRHTSKQLRQVYFQKRVYAAVQTSLLL